MRGRKGGRGARSETLLPPPPLLSSDAAAPSAATPARRVSSAGAPPLDAAATPLAAWAAALSSGGRASGDASAFAPPRPASGGRPHPWELTPLPLGAVGGGGQGGFGGPSPAPPGVAPHAALLPTPATDASHATGAPLSAKPPLPAVRRGSTRGGGALPPRLAAALAAERAPDSDDWGASPGDGRATRGSSDGGARSVRARPAGPPDAARLATENEAVAAALRADTARAARLGAANAALRALLTRLALPGGAGGAAEGSLAGLQAALDAAGAGRPSTDGALEAAADEFLAGVDWDGDDAGEGA